EDEVVVHGAPVVDGELDQATRARHACQFAESATWILCVMQDHLADDEARRRRADRKGARVPAQEPEPGKALPRSGQDAARKVQSHISQTLRLAEQPVYPTFPAAHVDDWTLPGLRTLDYLPELAMAQEGGAGRPRVCEVEAVTVVVHAHQLRGRSRSALD